MSSPRVSRKKWLIYPSFQLSVIAANIGLIALGLGFFLVQLFRSFAQLKNLGVEVSLPPDHVFFRFLDWQIHRMLISLGIAFLFGVVFSAVVTLLLSHKLAGPIVRLRQYFHNIVETGKVGAPVKFRRGDFFDDLPEIVNKAIERIEHGAKKKPLPRS